MNAPKGPKDAHGHVVRMMNIDKGKPHKHNSPRTIQSIHCLAATRGVDTVTGTQSIA